MVKGGQAGITGKRLLTVFGITVTGYLLLLVIKIVATGRADGFTNPTEDRPAVFHFSYSSWAGCTHCTKFEPIWDAFVKKSANLFKEALIVPKKYAHSTAAKPLKLGSPDYPEVAFVNDDDTKNPTRFLGPYTEDGLKTFMQQFERSHPDRIAQVREYRKAHPG